MRIITKTTLYTSYRHAFEMFNKDLFIKLSNALPMVNIDHFEGTNVGDKYQITISNPRKGKELKWNGYISESKILENEAYFTDLGQDLPWPLTFWRHCHRVIKISDNRSLLVDDVTYECSNRALEMSVYSLIYSQLMVRKPIYKLLLR